MVAGLRVAPVVGVKGKFFQMPPVAVLVSAVELASPECQEEILADASCSGCPRPARSAIADEFDLGQAAKRSIPSKRARNGEIATFAMH
mgnify:CR=1 FL=1